LNSFCTANKQLPGYGAVPGCNHFCRGGTEGICLCLYAWGVAPVRSSGSATDQINNNPSYIKSYLITAPGFAAAKVRADTSNPQLAISAILLMTILFMLKSFKNRQRQIKTQCVLNKRIPGTVITSSSPK
jgi:hypothetical protein